MHGGSPQERGVHLHSHSVRNRRRMHHLRRWHPHRHHGLHEGRRHARRKLLGGRHWRGVSKQLVRAVKLSEGVLSCQHALRGGSVPLPFGLLLEGV